MSRTMASPRPAAPSSPPSATWAKRSKMRSRCSGAIPGPVSRTATKTLPSVVRAARSPDPPTGCNGAVGQEIRQPPGELRLVTQEDETARRHAGRQRDVPLACLDLEDAHDAGDHRHQVDGAAVQGDGHGARAREVEQALREVLELRDVLAHRAEQMLLLDVEAVPLQPLDGHAARRDGRAQLV